MLLAGPGSGKTSVLTCRIARLLADSPGENFRILGLTFTNNAANEMRQRVEALVPGQGQRLFLGTFHSFCAEVMRQHGTHVGVNPDFTIYSQEADLQSVLNHVVDDIQRSGSHPEITDRDKKTLQSINRLKSFLVLPDECRSMFKDAGFGERMAAVYPAYENELAQRNALDFNSLLYKAWELFSRFPALAKRYRRVYPVICIDEFQDTNHAQYQVVRALTADEHKNLFVVADDDQIIYQWNGASHKRIKQLLADYESEVLQLPVNYRCPPQVVALANNLIRHNILRTPDKRPLVSGGKSNSVDTLRILPVFADSDAEAAGVAEDIADRCPSFPGEVVVLARSRRLLEGADACLRAAGIRTALAQRKDEFESTPFVWLHSLLRLASDRHNADSLESFCGTFTQLTDVPVDVDDIITLSQGSELGYLEHFVRFVRQQKLESKLASLVDEVSLCILQRRDFQAFSERAIAWFDELSKADKPSNDPSLERFALYDEERVVWRQLMREISASLGDSISLEAFLQELQMHSKESLPSADTVRLMTIHGAKGKEFDHVYLLGLVEDELPSFQSIKAGDGYTGVRRREAQLLCCDH